MTGSLLKNRDLNAIAAGYVGQPAQREVVKPDPAYSVRWSTHGYPDPVARWNVHPEYEVHLIQGATGRYIIGNEIGDFNSGQLTLVGPNVPHDWISNLEPDQSIPDRDVVLHFHTEWLARCAEVIPELRELDALLARAARGIEFTGETAHHGARELKRIGESRGAERAQRIFGLLNLLSIAPPEEYRLIMDHCVVGVDDPAVNALVNGAIDYIFANITGAVRLQKAASLAGMSPSAFSRLFKAASGHTFTDMVQQLRLTEAARLLQRTTKPISAIAEGVGYSNLSNFNRQFRTRHGMTPREYRRAQQ